jgi:hypothetical protein
VDLSRRDFLGGMCTLAAALAMPGAAGACVPPKMIEVGWHTPEPAALLPSLAQYEAGAPFDGLVLVLRNNNNRPSTQYTLGYNAWHARLERLDYYSTAINALKAVNTQAQRFTENFTDLRAQPGTDDWFQAGAWATNFQQCFNIARVARDSGCKGVFFDTESYGSQTPFQFAPTTQTLRDPSKTLDAYKAIVRQRGQEFMNALQAGFPGLQVLMTWGYWIAQTNNRYQLLPSFLDGMLDVATVALYDGYEHAYGFKSASSFDAALAEFTVGYGSQGAGYGQYYKPGFGLWLDYGRKWSATDFSLNYFQPAQWQTSLTLAMAKTSKYVWVYSEQPNWYDGTMPVQYVTATNMG